MNILNRSSSPRYKRDNIESFLLVSEKTSNSRNLSVTLVEMEVGGFQHQHSHNPEQMYYILEGKGEMTVDNDIKIVNKGDCIFFESNSTHGLKNIGDTVLKYLSAASPSFTKDQCDKYWPLESLNNNTEK